MKLRIEADFLHDPSSSRRRTKLLASASVVLSLGLLVNLWILHSRHAERGREAIQKYELQAQREALATEELAASQPRHKEKLIAAYRETLPWVEVLSAIERVDELHLDIADFRIDEGLVVLEVTASSIEQLSTAIAGLTERLPDWDIRTVRQSVTAGRATATLELRDKLFPPSLHGAESVPR